MNPPGRRERLGALARTRGNGAGNREGRTADARPGGAGGAAPAVAPDQARAGAPTRALHRAGRPARAEHPDFAAWIPGFESLNDRGPHWRCERPVPIAADVGAALRTIRDGSPHASEVEALGPRNPAGGATVLFLDLETCGFAGTPLFLAGLLVWSNREARLVQLLARDYAEEASVVRGALEILHRHPILVTFNGKSYDMPFLADRARMHGMEAAPPAGHLDLLHAARRRWKNVLPDCRLQTLEARFTGRRRAGDVPGSEVPERYHAFVRSGDARGLVPVLRHNLMDLLTLAEILGAIADPEDPGRHGWGGAGSGDAG